MAFTVVENPGRTLWCCTDGSSTYYLGQIVSLVTDSKAMINGAVVPLPVPHGAADTTHFAIPYGVVVGINNRTPVFSTVGSLSIQSGAGVVTQAAQLARDWVGAEGMYSKGDSQLLVQVTEITPNTVLRGPYYLTTYGTAITLLTNTATDTTGGTTAFATNTSGTTGGTGTPVTLQRTIYCRTGANRGLYRVQVDTSATAPQVTTAFPYDIVVGDTFVSVCGKQGLSYIYIAGPGLFIDNALGQGTNYFTVFCYKLNCEIAGQEYMEFRFSTVHFDNARA